VYVDLDNVGAPVLDKIRAEAAREGRVALFAVYADWPKQSSRVRDDAVALGIEPRQIVEPGRKNSADILIAVDVIAHLYAHPSFGVYVLATSDGDFVPVVHRLRSAGKRVIAVARAGRDVAASLRAVCDRVTEVAPSSGTGGSGGSGGSSGSGASSPSPRTSRTPRRAAKKAAKSAAKPAAERAHDAADGSATPATAASGEAAADGTPAKRRRGRRGGRGRGGAKKAAATTGN
jgi:hypothetical protein